MKTHVPSLRWLVLASLLLAAGCGHSDGELIDLAPASASENAPRTEVLTLRAEAIDPVISATGSVEPARAVDLSAPYMARVVEIPVEEGAVVEADALLLQLDTTVARLQAAQARANVAQTRVQLQLSEDELVRLTPLVDRGVVSEQQVDQLRSQRDALNESVSAVSAAARLAQTQVRDGSIRAPFAGTVTSIPTEVGAMATPGAPLIRVVDMSAVDIRVTLTEAQIAEMQLGMPVSVRVPALGLERTGTVRFISPELSTQTRTGEVLVRVDNADGRLFAGAFAELTFERVEVRSALVLPPSAVLRTATSSSVFVLEGDVVRRREVSLASLPDGRWQVLSGLEEGGRVVTGQIGRLTDGAQLTASAPSSEAAE